MSIFARLATASIATLTALLTLVPAPPAGAADGRIAIGGSWGTGYVGLFARAGLPRERLLDSQLADLDTLRRYRLVIVAGSVTNWSDAEQAIATYVSGGGCALLECTALPSAETLPGARVGAQAGPNFVLEGQHAALGGLPAGKAYTHNGYSAASITPDPAAGATVLARFTDEGASDKVKGKFVTNGQGAPSIVYRPLGQGHLVYSGPWMAYGMAFGRDYSDLVFALVSFLTGGNAAPRLTLIGSDNALIGRSWDPAPVAGEEWAEAALPEGFELIENPGAFGEYCLDGTVAGAAEVLLDYAGTDRSYHLTLDATGAATLSLPSDEPPITAKAGAVQAGSKLTITRRSGAITATLAGRHLFTTADRGQWPGTIAGKGLGEPLVQPLEPVWFTDDFMRDSGEAGEWQVVTGTWQVVSSEGTPATGANPFSYGVDAPETALVTAGQWFWRDYSAEISARWTQNTAGLAFHYVDPSNHDALEADQAAQRVRLVAVRNGERSVLDEAPAALRSWQWTRLAVRASNGTLVGLVDGIPVVKASGLDPSAGGIGLIATNTKAAFDDARVADWRACAPPLSSELAVWRPMGGDWQGGNSLTGRGDGAVRAPGRWSDPIAAARIRLGKAQGAGIRLVGDDDSAATVALTSSKGSVALKLMTRDGTGAIAPLKNLKPGDPHTVSVCRVRDELVCSVDGVPAFTRATELSRSVSVELINVGKTGAEFADVDIRPAPIALFPTDPPTPDYAGAVDVMTWAGPAFSWQPDPDDLSLFWHEGRAEGDLRLRAGVHKGAEPTASADLLLAPLGASTGYAARFTTNWGTGTVTATLTKAGKQLAGGAREGVPGESFLAEVERSGPGIVLRVNGMTVLTANDVDAPVDVRRAGVRLEGATLCCDDLALERSHVRNYTFSSAPADWLVQNGVWEVTSRWTCSPGWTWLSGLDAAHALVQSKWRVDGDVSVDTYVGAKMMNTPAGRKEVLQDFRLGICGKPGYLNAGYYFLIGAKGGQYTALQRNGLIVAEAPDFVVPQGSVHNDWLRLGIEKAGGRVSLLCQGQPVLTYDDPEPLSGGTVCIGAYDNGIMVPRVTVHGDIRQ